MTEGERVKWLRKYLGLTLEKFGENLGVTKTAISNIEKGIRNLTDQMLKSICREYGVREEWLRSGEGDPFGAQTRNQEIQAFINDVLAEEDESRRKRFIYALSRLDISGWEALEKVALAFLNDCEHEKED
ncbi:MAG: helix-turn-helix domain-containing protein [Agathobacter sp.]|nr:helix-turn-helix domain-containing protein [Agathobacter sp.]